MRVGRVETVGRVPLAAGWCRASEPVDSDRSRNCRSWSCPLTAPAGCGVPRLPPSIQPSRSVSLALVYFPGTRVLGSRLLPDRIPRLRLVSLSGSRRQSLAYPDADLTMAVHRHTAVHPRGSPHHHYHAVFPEVPLVYRGESW